MAALLLAGCGSKEPATIDTKALAEDLLNNVAFVDDLYPAEEGVIKMLYNIEDYVSAYVYIGSGATAEEIAVFELADADSAAAALALVEERVATQTEDFESYVPAEVQRLENAVVKQYGNYVIMCVSEGDKAAEIVSEYTK